MDETFSSGHRDLTADVRAALRSSQAPGVAVLKAAYDGYTTRIELSLGEDTFAGYLAGDQPDDLDQAVNIFAKHLVAKAKANQNARS